MTRRDQLHLRAARLVAVIALVACTPRSPPAATADRSTPADPAPAPIAVAPVVAPAAEPVEDPTTPPPPVIPHDPTEQVDLDLRALHFGFCDRAGPDDRPFVVGRDVADWSVGEPLWVVTNAGGVVRAAAGERIEHCGVGIDRPLAPDPSNSEEACVPAVMLVTASPIACDPPLSSGLPDGYTVDPGPEMGYVFVFHRRYRPPEVVPMSFEVRVHAICHDEETGAKVAIDSPPAAIDRHFASKIAGLAGLRWRQFRVVFGAPNLAPLELLHAVKHARGIQKAQWWVLREGPDGSVRSLVPPADRLWSDYFLLRDHDCGLPFSVPIPVLSFIHQSKLHWLTAVDLGEKVRATAWEVGDTQLRRLSTIPVALSSPKW